MYWSIPRRVPDRAHRTLLRTLQRTLTVLAIVPIATGLWTALAGADSVPSPREASPSVESELRFYSVWYIGAGLALLWLAPRLREHAREFRVFCGLIFLAGCSRVLAALATDWPPTGQIILMCIELTLPLALAAWHARAIRR